MDWREVYFHYETLVERIKEQNNENKNDLMRMNSGR
jgi:hypothetical protein